MKQFPLRSRLSLILFIVMVLAANSVFVIPAAAQVIIPPPIQPGVFTDPNWLKIDYHRVNIIVENQIARTNVDMQFTNQGEALAEGTFVFPLPEGAAVDELVMYIDGQAIEAKILPAEEARGIYNEIVRQYRDPALLEYIGTSAIQANVFPIPPGDSRRVEIGYSQVLEADNGLLHLVYPLHSSANAGRVIGQMSVSVQVTSADEIRNIYSPSHDIAISREGENSFRAGFEAVNFQPGDDFSLYYGLANDQISVNLLTYRESADQDGFFMLLVQPPLSVPEDQITPKDVIIVLDQSGSMQGSKWDQARDAASYVLDNLNPRDRFNMVVFSTGRRVYSNQLESADQAEDAINWINGMIAEGGTDINLALTTALDMADAERPTTILFLTDGLATEGEINTDVILQNLQNADRSNVRIFSFGVGDDVDTFLLDQIVQAFRGTGSYVRPTERIDEEVSSLYNKISAPVLNDITLDFGDVRTELLYPQELPDLFAGEQLTLVGRFRDTDDNATLTLSGSVDGQPQAFIYNGLAFRENAGGEAFIARLWATRRIGDLLNTIRLNGESDELVDSVVSLSVRYGIITPYTSFLIEEDDILTQQGRDRAADEFAENEARALNEQQTGAAAVDAADGIANINQAQAPIVAAQSTMQAFGGSGPTGDFGGGGSFEADEEAAAPPFMGIPGTPTPAGTMVPGGAPAQPPAPAYNALETINDKTFVNINGVWNDTTYTPDEMETTQVVFLSDAYFALLDEFPELADYFSLGDHLIVVLDGVAYEVVPEA
ncbi:MAG: hypothetical protein OHK0046_22140 [Anaerolineae bacterium]